MTPGVNTGQSGKYFLQKRQQKTFDIQMIVLYMRLKLMGRILSMPAITLYFNCVRAHVSQITGHECDVEFKTRPVNHIAAFSGKGFLATQKEEKE